MDSGKNIGRYIIHQIPHHARAKCSDAHACEGGVSSKRHLPAKKGFHVGVVSGFVLP